WFAGTSTALMLAANPAALPQASAQDPDYKALLQRLDEQQKQIQTLTQRLEDTQPVIKERAGAIVPAAQDTSPAGFQKQFDEAMAARDARARADADAKQRLLEEEDYKVGSNRALSAVWSNVP